MKKLHLYPLLLILTLAFSCQKGEDDLTLRDEFEYTPVFTFMANDGIYNIAAGINSFYMFSDFEVDDMNVYSFIASFAKLSTCTVNCKESLTIKIRDFQAVETTDEIAIVTSVAVGDYNYLDNLDFNGFSNVLIEYTNEDGVVFRSDLVAQPVENTFQILSVSDFYLNENNQKTKQLEIAFDCFLRDAENGTTISFDNAEATIAVAYPE